MDTQKCASSYLSCIFNTLHQGCSTSQLLFYSIYIYYLTIALNFVAYSRRSDWLLKVDSLFRFMGKKTNYAFVVISFRSHLLPTRLLYYYWLADKGDGLTTVDMKSAKWRAVNKLST